MGGSIAAGKDEWGGRRGTSMNTVLEGRDIASPVHFFSSVPIIHSAFNWDNRTVACSSRGNSDIGELMCWQKRKEKRNRN